MNSLARATTLSGDPRQLGTTGAGGSEGLYLLHHQVARQSKWMDCVETIRGWTKELPDWDEDEIEVPTKEAMRRAISTALGLCDHGWPEPTRAVPDGEGGVVFEHRDDGLYEALTISESDFAQLDRFVDSRLVKSLRFSITRFL